MNVDAHDDRCAETMRAALRCSASGVALVMTCDAGQVHGITVSTFVPVSLDPPHILISIKSTSRVAQAISNARRFAVSVLSAGQQNYAEHFAMPFNPDRQVPALPVIGTARDMPAIADALAIFDCDLLDTIVIATHDLMIGIVRDVVSAGGSGEPLLYCDRRYRHLAP